MRLLGIDYGSKKVGVALSDEEGVMAFPKTVLPNDSRLLDILTDMIKRERVGSVIMGDSKNYGGEDNVIMKQARVFAEKLQNMSGCEIVFEPEMLTTKEAERIQGSTEFTDASAAALILQSYIDKRTAQHGTD